MERGCVTRSGKVRIFFAVCAAALNLSCRTVLVMPPPCPVPSEGVVIDLTEMVVLREFKDVQRWVAEMDRYCDAIDAMLSD
jgi:hypothetical protein